MRAYHRVMQELWDCPGWLFVEVGHRLDSLWLYSLGSWFYERGHRHWWARQRG